jgi:hypothetical protein
LKRQGLPDLSGKSIDELATKALEMTNHPLAIRWYAWACRKDINQWQRTVKIGDLKQIEDFCVSSTLTSLGKEAQRTLGSILAIDNAPDSSMDCIQHVANVDQADIEGVLFDLECSGMLNVVTNETGVTTYSVAPMARRLAAELARNNGWEVDYVQRLKQFARWGRPSTESPLIRDILALRPANIRLLNTQEKEEVVKRIGRALSSANPSDRIRLIWLKAECARHLQQLVTADDTYTEAAEAVLTNPQSLPDEERWHLLLEAATVARARAVNRYQIDKAIRFLKAAESTEAENTRLIGMLAELYGSIGDRKAFTEYAEKAKQLLEEEDPEGTFAYNLSAAVERGRESLSRPTKR